MALDYLCCTIENIFTLIKVESIQENVCHFITLYNIKIKRYTKLCTDKTKCRVLFRALN